MARERDREKEKEVEKCVYRGRDNKSCQWVKETKKEREGGKKKAKCFAKQENFEIERTNSQKTSSTNVTSFTDTPTSRGGQE